MSRLIYAGTPETAVAPLRRLLSDGHEIVAVLTRPDAPLGRKRVLTPSPVAQEAAAHGLPVIKATRIDDETHAAIAALDAELAVVVAYGGLIPRRTLDAVRHGWVNLHFSLLPLLRGAAPVQHALIQCHDITGASVFLLEEGLDTGPVLGMMTEAVVTPFLSDRDLALQNVRYVQRAAGGLTEDFHPPRDGFIQTRARQVLSEAVDLLAPHSDHLHLVDSVGVDGEGVQVGDGEIDWPVLARQLDVLAPGVGFIPEIWQGHVNNGEGFWLALERLEEWF